MNTQTNISTTVLEELGEKSLLKLEALLEQKYDLNSTLIEKLLEDIKNIFGTKMRNDGSHYIDHLIATLNYANSISGKSTCDEDTIIIALLHDIHEENPKKITLDYIANAYSPTISIAIDILSKAPKVLGEDEKQSNEERSRRNSQYFERYKNIEQLKAEVKKRAPEKNIEMTEEEIDKLAKTIAIVKIGDRVHNLTTEVKADKIEETEKYFGNLVQEIGGRAKKYIYLAISGFRFQLALRLGAIKTEKILEDIK